MCVFGKIQNITVTNTISTFLETVSKNKTTNKILYNSLTCLALHEQIENAELQECKKLH